MALKKVDYEPKRTESGWTVHRSFITHWLIRGDIKNQGDGTYVRLVDDPYLPGHKAGHVYEVRE